MNRFALGMLLVALVAGCGNSKGDDDDDNTGQYLLESGDYVTSNSVVNLDDCNTGVSPGELNGKTWQVTVDGNSVNLVTANSDIDLSKSGDALSRSESGQLDYNENPNPKDCVVTLSVANDGSLTADNEFDLTEALTVEYVSGAECDQAVSAELPCETEFAQHFARQ